MADYVQKQRSTELTSLTDALAKLDRIEPVAPGVRDLHAALGFTLAADAGPRPPLRLAGARLRRIDIALLLSLGIKHVPIRAPHVLIVRVAQADNNVDATGALITSAIHAEGGTATTVNKPLEAALRDESFDAVIALSGDNDARDDASLRTLANLGQVEFEGVALTPGGAIAFGNVSGRPVLLLPGRIETALAAWLVIGRRLLARLSFRLIEEQPFLLELARPLVSTRGIAEVVPVRRRAAQVEPLANDWTPQTIARADGWILLPAESEGLPAGSKVAMRPWP